MDTPCPPPRSVSIEHLRTPSPTPNTAEGCVDDIDPTLAPNPYINLSPLNFKDVRQDPILTALAKSQSTHPPAQLVSTTPKVPPKTSTTMFSARPAPASMKTEGLGPRMTKSAALRQGLAWEEKPRRPATADGGGKVEFGNVEGYYKVKDNVPDYEWYPGCLVLANGDTNGYSFHADWLNGWPSGMLVDAYDKCARAGKLRGSVDGCEVFEASRDQDKAFHCEAKGQTVAEAIGLNVPLAALPGNNPEFNSSKLAANHDKATMGTARILSAAPEIVTIPADGSGSCVTVGGGKVCSDYAGGGQVANAVEDTGMDGLPPSFTVSNGAMGATSTSMGMGMGMVQSPSPSPPPMMNGTNANLMANDDIKSAATVTVTVTATASASECVCSPHMRRSRFQRGQ